MKKTRMTFWEMADVLRANPEKVGVVVIKQHPKWDKEYPILERSYRVRGDNKYFRPGLCGNSIFGNSIEGHDWGVRLDWYIFDSSEDGWDVEYCYVEGEE